METPPVGPNAKKTGGEIFCGSSAGFRGEVHLACLGSEGRAYAGVVHQTLLTDFSSV